MEPVTDDVAPRYSEIVEHPMDLILIRSKMPAYRLDPEPHESFAKDMRLVWANCIAYNEADSEFGVLAQNFSDVFEVGYKKILANDGGRSDQSPGNGDISTERFPDYICNPTIKDPAVAVVP